jgi:hypothetical protein
VRSSRTDHGKRSRVCFRLELGVAAPARGFTHAVPPRRLPLTAANSRPKQGIKKFAPGIGQKDASRVQNKIHGNTHHSDGEFWRYEASIVYDFGRTHMNEKLNIFVSSVQKELEDERVIVQNLLNTDSFLSAHCSPILYEFEPASPDKALEGCLKSLDGCHVYLLIVAAQYGTLVGKLSITHAEYRRSKEKKLPVLAFIKGDRKVKREDDTEALLQELDDDGPKYKRFGNVIELQKEVRAALVKLLLRLA